LLTDIAIGLRDRDFRPVYRVAAEHGRAPRANGWLFDAAVVSGRSNLEQAIILRLLTPQGELAELGHPDYGSRVHELIGSGNTETKRSLLRLRVLEALQREPRIATTDEVIVVKSPGRRSAVDVTVRVTPVGGSATVTIGPLRLDLAP
jgi:phage baseplate assembly protein W